MATGPRAPHGLLRRRSPPLHRLAHRRHPEVDTLVAPTASQRQRLAQGFAQGGPAPSLDIGEPLAGGGALRSTGNEVLRFLESAMGAGTSTPALSAAWARALTPHRPIGPAMPGTTMGLLVAIETASGTTRYTKNGGTPGFSTYLMFSTTPRVAVVVLANGNGLSTTSLKQVAESVLDRVQATP